MRLLVGGSERYALGERLGEGGFGAVYRASPVAGGPQVALKLLHLDALLRDEARSRFRREARVAQALVHPNVVRILDWGETDDCIPFIAWELLEGRTLEELLREGPLTPRATARVARQVLSALAEAHAREVIHRDIKPSNVFVEGSGREAATVKVLDFGVAAVRAEFASQSLTAEGMTVGTPAYMAPEQVLAEKLDGRSDLYALGLVLAECVTGRPVYGGDTGIRVALEQASTAPVPLAPEVESSRFGALIARATQKDRTQRFASALEMREAFDGAGRGLERSSLRRVAVALAIVALLAAGAAAFAWARPARTQRVAKPTTFDASTYDRCLYRGKNPTELVRRLESHGYISSWVQQDVGGIVMSFEKKPVMVTVSYSPEGTLVSSALPRDSAAYSVHETAAPPCSLTIVVHGAPSLPGAAKRLLDEVTSD